jgi:hypothetical protein
LLLTGAVSCPWGVLVEHRRVDNPIQALGVGLVVDSSCAVSSLAPWSGGPCG